MDDRLKTGVTMFPTDYSIHPAELAVAAEERGFESMWVPEHTHIPAERRTPYPGAGELPKEYSHTLDPFVALGIAAGDALPVRIVRSWSVKCWMDLSILAATSSRICLLTSSMMHPCSQSSGNTQVPIDSPFTARSRLPSTNMSNTRIGMAFSMQSVKAVLSMTRRS